MPNPEQQTAQRPDLGVEKILPADPLTISREQFPWISEPETSLHTVSVQLDGLEMPFRYGSIVGENNSLAKIADTVSEQNSVNAEQGMFKAVINLLQNRTAPTVDIIPGVSDEFTVYKTSKKGNDVARLFFTLVPDENGEPVLLKLGIAPHKKQQAMIGILRQERNNQRKKKNS